MRKQDFYYDLPEELIAQDPLADRSSSRLLVLDRKSGQIRHRTFTDVTDYLDPGDCLVINDTKVIPARLMGVREKTGGHVEVLLLKRLSGDLWEALTRPGRKARPGERLVFGDGVLTGTVEEIGEEGNRLIRFAYDGIFEEVLDQLGQMPLPPYITHQLKDPDRYQTVYARHKGSAAAPTAGLHFTPELLKKVRDKGVDIAAVTLHVGLGTFRPVKEDNVLDHHMHEEWYQVSHDAAERINAAHERGSRVICVGTTSCRTIEAAAGGKPCAEPDIDSFDGGLREGIVQAGNDDTKLFIYPGYRFQVTDRLITNFHLPESTLLMLVSALAGRKHVLDAYREAVQKQYRFFSFGDAMIII